MNGKKKKVLHNAVKYTKKKKKSWIIHCRRWILWYVNCISIKLLKNPMNDIVTVVVQLLSCVLFFVTPWTAAYQAPLYSTISQSLLKCISIESVMLSNMSPPSPPALNISQHQGLPMSWLFSSSGQSIGVNSFSISPSNE